MGFYFCDKYIYTDGDEKEVERDMYATLSYFRGFNDQDGCEKWENQLEHLFRYLSLTPAQKYHYAQMMLAGEVYWWWEDNHFDYRDWLVSQKLLHTQYAPHLEGPQFNDLIVECKEIFTDMVMMLESQAVEIVEDPEPEPKLMISQSQNQKLLLSWCNYKKRFPCSPRKL